MISGDPNDKIFYLRSLKDTEKLKNFLAPYKKAVLVGGCFDVLHYGHVVFFKNAKKQKGSLIVLLEPDTSLLKRKKRKAIHTQRDRAEMVAAISYVDAVVAIPHFTKDEEYEKLVKIIKPRVIAVTEGDELLRHKKNHAKLVGAQVIEVTPKIKGLSTSLITNYATLSSD
ncbi:hypothetical protein A3G67_02325 [Candidatus Roizmanbacteria bacterium RIFCSPLOWO2_12_FULL_40_12]|uniref:Cytidyltransferase-like domain-containing protein n=1 Tax=Candidatus Roizmanbacteria bacterium RIFCSPLOWO2_01_FULL_40_42 TaxID=1802066 RepID=A0A1F7J4Z0_9BACT|nr:MAG: hypothetical protein A2779_01585 [Candidatus Roizmanbacteria bacterium RIFCSPHIGHO2_01_FULL_40_98]OGK29051.1 MAG: hypothetical protein A3C31_02225 [Candidatus Roizmanbacteria bacterium RIFCSPHIGHO2_02_FULL_40_53]OGK29963.1 MAG: hypothetical protein A2W49_00040 [Candidatus Roizmanbacteria bacterium RIFCSPHIGHO2_12_41_18]OGK36306.1 MAG: hypothetical protein A3E69_03670 [Candidatus Roizmanbacteria bacterium RIFCSPHIGHO2_12_FULL_40_130]OGK50678.1 MAG: hypothetical protein A3B50_00680 [Candi